MSYIVKGNALETISLCQSDTVASVLQNLALIYTTKKGTVPMYRELGLAMEYLDKPENVAKAIMVSEITTETEEFEPRAKLVQISFDYDTSAPGKIIPVVEVEIENE
jgi:phage baseplate assembly protein W